MKIEVRNPRTGKTDFAFEEPPADVVTATAERLRAEQKPWDADGVDARVDYLLAWRGNIEVSRSDILAALVVDTGRVAESHLEIDAVLGMIDRWCAQAPDLLARGESRPASIPFVDVMQNPRPYSLVGIVSPWNFPLLLALIDAIPALAAGSAVLLKPSEITPRFIEPLARTIPAEVPLAIVAGAAATGEQIVDLADAVCFTGSVPTGRRVGERAMARFIPAFLELGGKDPAVVLASADLDRATSAILWGGTANAGQSCLSIERIYVDRSLFEPFVDLLVQKASALRLAEPAPADGEIGPIIAAKQVDVIAAHLADSEAKGAKALTGGSVEQVGGGSYVRPTVLTGVDHGMRVMIEETFGPVLPVMPFDSPDEAVALANDTIYGLSAAVFGDRDEALAVAARIDAGAVSINDAALTALIHDGEKNSFHLSGLGGSRMGPASLRRFVRKQAFLIGGPHPDPWWYATLR